MNEKGDFLNDQAAKIEEMIKMYNTMIAKIGVLKRALTMFDGADTGLGSRVDAEKDSSSEPLLNDSNRLKFCYMGGTLLKEDQFRFKKLLFRATRGKAYVKFYPMDIPKGDRLRGMVNQRDKVVYIVMFQDGKVIRDKTTKLCSSFLEPL